MSDLYRLGAVPSMSLKKSRLILTSLAILKLKYKLILINHTRPVKKLLFSLSDIVINMHLFYEMTLKGPTG